MRHYCQCSFDLPILNLQSATFGFFEINSDLVKLLKHILILYKYYIYSSTDSSKLSFPALLKNIQKAFDLEKKSTGHERKTKAFTKNGVLKLGNFMN